LLLSRRKAFEIAEEYLNRLRERYTLRLVILFGSFAKDQWTETSDIDLLIVADELQDSIGENYIRLKERYIEPFGVKTEDFEKQIEALNFIILDAMEYGEILYKDPATYARARMRFDEVKRRHKLTRTEKGWNYKVES